MSGSCVAMAGMTLRMRVSRRSFTGRFVVYIQGSGEVYVNAFGCCRQTATIRCGTGCGC